MSRLRGAVIEGQDQLTKSEKANAALATLMSHQTKRQKMLQRRLSNVALANSPNGGATSERRRRSSVTKRDSVTEKEGASPGGAGGGGGERAKSPAHSRMGSYDSAESAGGSPSAESLTTAMDTLQPYLNGLTKDAGHPSFEEVPQLTGSSENDLF